MIFNLTSQDNIFSDDCYYWCEQEQAIKLFRCGFMPIAKQDNKFAFYKTKAIIPYIKGKGTNNEET